jgi:hypothetical protein
MVNSLPVVSNCLLSLGISSTRRLKVLAKSSPPHRFRMSLASLPGTSIFLELPRPLRIMGHAIILTFLRQAYEYNPAPDSSSAGKAGFPT